MNVIYLLITISIGVAVCFLVAFLWAVKDGQFEDDYSPSVRVLFDDKQIDNVPQNKETDQLLAAKTDN